MTEEEMLRIWFDGSNGDGDAVIFRFARAIEAAEREASIARAFYACPLDEDQQRMIAAAIRGSNA